MPFFSASSWKLALVMKKKTVLFWGFDIRVCCTICSVFSVPRHNTWSVVSCTRVSSALGKTDTILILKVFFMNYQKIVYLLRYLEIWKTLEWPCTCHLFLTDRSLKREILCFCLLWPNLLLFLLWPCFNLKFGQNNKNTTSCNPITTRRNETRDISVKIKETLNLHFLPVNKISTAFVVPSRVRCTAVTGVLIILLSIYTT